ncbi:hypothetical protein [Brevundimonas vesicularis]|uniref:hypothetical protein n=1 Tax=Brevundimonas vesicularis TaxID=41276 RepID=UPI0022AC07CC|nr:hypothetical protein [Brevundimonas vesicularis]
MTDAISLPRGGADVLNNLLAQRSSWHGWEGGHPARSPEAQDAFTERARAITAMREIGLIDENGMLTEAGRLTAEAWNRRHA